MIDSELFNPATNKPHEQLNIWKEEGVELKLLVNSRVQEGAAKNDLYSISIHNLYGHGIKIHFKDTFNQFT